MYIQKFNKVCIKDYALYILANRLTSVNLCVLCLSHLQSGHGDDDDGNDDIGDDDTTQEHWEG